MKKQNKNKIKEGNRTVTAVLYILAAIAAFITLYPMYYVLILSLSEPAYAATMRVYLVPKGFNLSAFQVLVTDMKMWRAYANTVLYVVPTTILMIATSTVVAFGLNYKKLMGRKFLTMFLLIPMYFAGGTIPSFLLIVKLGLYDSPFSQVIPACFSIWNIILVKAYFRSIPESLTEAARIDGASLLQVLLKVFVPLGKPIFAVLAEQLVFRHALPSSYGVAAASDVSEKDIGGIQTDADTGNGCGNGQRAGHEAAFQCTAEVCHDYIYDTSCVVYLSFFPEVFCQGYGIGLLKRVND